MCALPIPSRDELLASLADKVPAMLAYWDADRRCRFANRAYEMWFGMTPDQIVGRHMSEILGPLYAKNLPYIEGVLRGEPQEFEREIPDPNGGAPRHSQALYIPDLHDGVVHGFFVLVVDITRRKNAEEAVRRMERQLQAVERLTAIATLAAGIAHEINNPLAATLGNLELLLQRHGSTADRETREELLAARDGVLRAADIIKSMRLLVRGEASGREIVDVDSIVIRGIELSHVRYRARITCALGGVGTARVNPTQLAQVIVNLLTNAADALAEGRAGEIRVATHRTGNTIAIEVNDNGRGIATEIQSRIFEPFFTTKDVGAGMGLGLSISRGIVDSFGGTISFQSEPDAGTTFVVELPGATQETPSSQPLASTHRPRVLVIDDDMAVSSVAQRILAKDWDVTVANSGHAALEVLARQAIDVVLCDLMMPGISGPDIHAAIVGKFPALAKRFVFMTGGAFTEKAEAFLRSSGAPVVAKPFAASELRQALDAFLTPL